MREPFTQLYVHLVWATWDRLPLIEADLRRAIYGCIQDECRSLKVEPVAIGGTEDHVHVLARLPATVGVAELMKQIKGVSSHLVTHRLAPERGFKWQGAYGAFSVSTADVPRIREYILHQEQHHARDQLDASLELPPPQSAQADFVRS